VTCKTGKLFGEVDARASSEADQQLRLGSPIPEPPNLKSRDVEHSTGTDVPAIAATFSRQQQIAWPGAGYVQRPLGLDSAEVRQGDISPAR
jgi:hypothetical protein